jgi:hypothetical protein
MIACWRAGCRHWLTCRWVCFISLPFGLDPALTARRRTGTAQKDTCEVFSWVPAGDRLHPTSTGWTKVWASVRAGW